MEKYSVLMSLYIKEKSEYLIESIESILKQTIFPDEIVIVEDGPITEELREVLRYYQRKYPQLFKIVSSKKNLGLGLALNLGLENCKNELVARMDTDDISLPTRCEEQLKEFERDSSLGIVGTMIDEFRETKENIISTRRVPISHKEIYQFAKRRSAFNHPTVMYKKSVVLSFGGYKNLRKNQDFNLFGRMLYGGVKAKNIDKSLLLFRNNEDFLEKRGSWLSTKYYIKATYDLWRLGYSKFTDFILCSSAQITFFILPKYIQSVIYTKILRKGK